MHPEEHSGGFESSRRLTRRRFLKGFGAAAVVGGSLPEAGGAETTGLPADKSKPVRIGIITDLHHGLQPDATRRLETFMQQAVEEKPDFIIQLGDFCHPRPDARECIQLWERFPGARYHVLGNHDMDLATKQQTMDFWGLTKPYYSFDVGDFHFVVLDCNFILKEGRHLDYANSNYYIARELRDRISPEQIEWLRADLAATKLQTIIFSHQAFDEIWDGFAVPNRLEVRAVIREANRRSTTRAGARQVIACLCGHHHLDEASVIEGVNYLQLNSASYYWAGDKRGSDGPRAVYDQSLYAFVTVDPAGQIQIKGQRSHFRKPTPEETGHPNAPRLSATISDRTLRF